MDVLYDESLMERADRAEATMEQLVLRGKVDQVVAVRARGGSLREAGRVVGWPHQRVKRLVERPEIDARIEESRAALARIAAKERDRKRRAEAERQRRLGKKAEELRSPPQPTAPPPVPKPALVKGSIEEEMWLRANGQRPTEEQGRRRRRRIPYIDSSETILASPTDQAARLERGAEPYSLAAFRPVTSGPDFEAWLDANERMLVARDPSDRGRVFRIDPSLRAEYEADGFAVS